MTAGSPLSDRLPPAEPIAFPATLARRLAESGRRIVITGAGGWIGLATLEMLAGALGDALADRVVCFGSQARVLRLRNGRQVVQHELAEIADLPTMPTLLLHTAFLTKDKVAAMDEQSYVEGNGRISQMVLDALDRIGTEAIFVASSGAAYRAGDPQATHDFQLYGELKRQDEERFAAWAQSAGRCAVIARIFNISGPYINKPETYALASFILDALAGRPIEVRASHKVVRAYVAVQDVMSLVFSLLLAGDKEVTRFDTAGAPMELAEVARRVADRFGQGEVRRAAITAAREDHYAGSREPYESLLKTHGITPGSFDDQLMETAQFLVARIAESS